jgi:hypothetical protein
MGYRHAIWAAGAVLGLSACSGTTAPTTLAPAPPGIEKTLFVAPERRSCTGVAPMECLQVRAAPELPWQYFYSEIEGFTHEPGYAYELRVREEKVADPPADGSSLRWQLLEVVSKVRTPSP